MSLSGSLFYAIISRCLHHVVELIRLLELLLPVHLHTRLLLVGELLLLHHVLLLLSIHLLLLIVKTLSKVVLVELLSVVLHVLFNIII